MLRKTFLHLPGIGKTLEAKLWQSGITDWDDYDQRKASQLRLFPNDQWNFLSPLNASREALEKGDADHFASRMPSAEHYRILLSFPRETLFLDIETTGLSRWYDYITMVGWEMDGSYNAYVKGSSAQAMFEAFARAKAIVTFNGSLFDIPFIRQEFPDLPLPICHVDLRFFSRRVNVSGGQKVVEKLLGIERSERVNDIGGETAPVLWHNYCWGDIESLKLLIEYNHFDIQGLKQILDSVIARFTVDRNLPINQEDVPHFYRKSSTLSFSSSGDSFVGIRVEPYNGDTGPAVTFQGLGTEEGSRVVGIDLTGSESRPSGWCLLDGSTATTLRLKSDEDIISTTLKAKPSIISIDSPLSLPNGRIMVEDTDPGRSKFGIMRECERILKRRGINVYPCLLPSMQRLTQRGISLAQRFRKLGIPVIESYPGAAQDIIRIPRKQAGLHRLIQGLARFGIEGEFINGTFSHDELDAITSALVGLFFLAGKFEALGSDLDENLIVPDITNEVSKWGQRIVIGLSGQIASGKTTAGTVLKESGFEYTRYSVAIAKIAHDRGMPDGRDQLQILGQDIFETEGQYWLGRQLLRDLPPDVDLVIDGLRHPEDLSFWAENFGPNFHHIHVVAEKKIRRQRYMDEGNDGSTFDKIVNHQAEAEIPKLEKRAHTIICNEKTKETFGREILTRAQLLKVGRSGVEQCQ